MNLLADVITYVRRLIKTYSNVQITDALIIDYINRFWIMDVDARIQLFDLKTTYEFQTIPGIDSYNLPIYSIQTEDGSQNINYYPVYQGVAGYCAVNGIQVPFYNQKSAFYSIWPNYVQALNGSFVGDGGTTYSLSLPFFPAIPGHVDMQGIIKAGSPQGSLYAANNDPLFLGSTDIIQAIETIPTTSIKSGVFFTATDNNGQNIVVADTGLFLQSGSTSELYGALMAPGKAPNGNSALSGGYSSSLNTINYTTGVANVVFPVSIPAGNPINVQCYFYEQGLPRAILYYDNVITLRNPPDIQYLISLEAYLSPAAFLTTTNAIPFAYMSEYIARGAARKILADTGDIEQFQFYEPLFREQEMLVWKRSQRIFTSTRTQTIFSEAGVGNLSTNTTQGGT